MKFHFQCSQWALGCISVSTSLQWLTSIPLICYWVCVRVFSPSLYLLYWDCLLFPPTENESPTPRSWKIKLKLSGFNFLGVISLWLISVKLFWVTTLDQVPNLLSFMLELDLFQLPLQWGAQNTGIASPQEVSIPQLTLLEWELYKKPKSVLKQLVLQYLGISLWVFSGWITWHIKSLLRTKKKIMFLY